MKDAKVKNKELKTHDGFILGIGFLLILMELWKQLTLFFVKYNGSYNVWYFPFQLCSMPMYLIIVYGLLLRYRPGIPGERMRKVILTFLQDYGFLGGIMSLMVHDGLIHQGYPLLTLHGFVWHILLLLLSLYISLKKLSLSGIKGFFSTVPLFGCCAALAELINISLHSFGDCDMFYISPFHVSSQMVFCDIDRLTGRPAGILIYLGMIVIGAFLVHIVLEYANKLLTI